MVLGLMVGAKVDEYVERTDPGEFRVLEADGELVSLLRMDRQAQWWLGRALPSAQVLQLATPPQHRGAGHGAGLLAGLLGELHHDDVPLVTLTPSTFPFYRGSGFEVAGSWTMYEARAEHLPKRTAPYRARPVSLDDPAELAAVYARVAPTRHGAFDRGERFWRRLARRTRDKTVAAFVLDGPEGPAGWAVATLEFRPDPAAIYALEDRFAHLVDRWHWMLRLVDLSAALQARPWPSGVAGQVAFRVEDPALPWNTGTWRLELSGGEGWVDQVPAASGAATADIRGLASLFTGFAGPDDLLRAGLLGGFDPAAVDLLRAAFASPRPWTAEFY